MRQVQSFLASIGPALRDRSIRRAADRPSPVDQTPLDPPPGFLLGCGPRGTAMLDAPLSLHPDAQLLVEPRDLWTLIDQRTNEADAQGGKFFMDARHASDRARVRFNRLLHRARGGAAVLIEATPHNVCRVGFLEALAPGARFLHLVRCGLHTAQAIASAADEADAAAPWWGADGGRWAALARDGAGAGYFPEEVGPLETSLQRGAYEWLVGLAEADRWRHRLGPRFAGVTSTALDAGWPGSLITVAAHFGLPADPAWLARASRRPAPHGPDPTREHTPNQGEVLRLPPRMTLAFNAQQERYGFAGRALPLDGARPRPAGR